ncbi:MAG: hypothetical protein K6G26_04825 [Lachnospiraceae bacterium]|nr:hypothetical protein [Lachnospiraceae bacterium]
MYNNGSTLSDEFKRYCLISSELDINSNCEVNIKGNIWAGDGGIKIKDGLTKCKVECDSMYAGGGLNLTDCYNKTSTGVTNFKMSMLAGSKSDSLYPYLAAKKIVVDSSNPASNDTDNNNKNLDVSAACIVGDDLVLESPYSTASFTGTYSGVGSGATSFGNSRSSIILNGKYSSLDMQLEALLLAGQACVNGSLINNIGDTDLGVNFDSKSLNDIVTGESISVRGNQAAYLIPVEYLPFSGNPVLIDEYNTVIYNYDGSSNNERLTNLKNEIVSNISAAKPDVAAHLADTNKIATYFYKPYGTTQLVYFYYNFSEAGAKLYFQENYMNGATDMINQFASLIPVKSININSVVYNVMGNFVTRADSVSQEVRAATGDAGGADNARRRYNNLKAFFSTSTSAVTNADGSAYDYNSASALNYLIKWENIQKSPAESTNVIDSTIDGYRVLVVDNKDFSAVEVPNGFCGIVIATGDVKVATGNAKGLFVAQGKVTLSVNANIEADTTIINAILRNADSYEAPETTTYKVDGEPITLKDVFANYNESSAVEEVGSFVSMEKMIGYANWRKN